MHQHRDDESDETFEAAWMSFARPLMRLGFASGLDTSDIRWHNAAESSRRQPEEITAFLERALEADRQCDLTALSGPLYVVSPEVHVVIAACAASLSFREIAEAFRHEELPAETGMIVLPDRAPWVSIPHTRAVTWHRFPELVWDGNPQHSVPTMRMKGYAHSTVFHHLNVPGAQLSVINSDALFFSGDRDMEPCLGDLEPDHAQEFEEFLLDATAQRRAMDGFMNTADAISADAGEPVGEARLDHDPGQPIPLARYVAAFIRVLDQDIADAARVPRAGVATDGPHRDKPAQEPDIQIVRLRRIPNTGDSTAGPGRFSHRWVVQMHKVRQWYPSLGRHKTIWRGPYIKGPAGAPLKEPHERVHAVVH
jgi:hypothetical protein